MGMNSAFQILFMKTTKYIFFLLSLVLLFLPMWFVPLLQEQFPSMQVKPVVGYFGATKKPTFYGKRWMSNDYQKAYSEFVKAKNPLHATSIRLKSQMDYSLYGDIMHANILSGKNGFLFQKEGCEAFIGRDFKGEEWITEKVKKLKFIKDYFEKEGIQFLVLTPPLKARIFEEHLPSFYRKNKTEETYWHYFPQILKAHNITVLDFSFFISNKKQYPYDLYPPSGQHWTKYGAAVVGETVKAELEKMLDVSMVELQWKDSVKLSTAQVEFDNELVAGANFLWTPPLNPLPYPKVRYIENDSTIYPNVLAVGDSFYKLFYEFGFVNGLFSKDSEFWYYNHEIFPTRLEKGKRLTNKDLNILEEIRKRDVIILTVFEDNLDRFAFEFVENVYSLLQE